jgi:hypothetical protein
MAHCLPRIQSVLNNARALSSADRTPNEIAYGFTLNFALDYTMDPDRRFEGATDRTGQPIAPYRIGQRKTSPNPIICKHTLCSKYYPYLDSL